MQDRFRQLEYPFQKKKITAILRHYNNALALIDATGLGDPIVDDLLREGLNIEAIKITEPLKKELIEKLSIWIDQKKLTFLPIKETIEELEDFTYEIGPTGKIRYGAPSGRHDDTVIAHSLALHSLYPLNKQVETKPPTLIQRYFRTLKDREQRSIDEWAEW